MSGSGKLTPRRGAPVEPVRTTSILSITFNKYRFTSYILMH